RRHTRWPRDWSSDVCSSDLIAGVRDTQVEMADIDLLLHSGPTPKEAWIHPAGGHMGRDAKDWPDPVIFRKVTMPWLLRALEVKEIGRASCRERGEVSVVGGS